MRKGSSRVDGCILHCVSLFLVWAGPTICSAAAEPPSTRPAPTLFIVGDSTVKNGTPGQLGWGDPLARYFDRTRIKLENRARGGRSSRTFQTEGLWGKVLSEAQPGDFLLIQMGHNDGGPLDGPARARGSIRGTGEETRDIDNPIGTSPQDIKFKYFTAADNTHTSPAGAELNGKCVVEGLRGLKYCPLEHYLSNEPRPTTQATR